MSASTGTGLTRCMSKPARRARSACSSLDHPVIAMSRLSRVVRHAAEPFSDSEAVEGRQGEVDERGERREALGALDGGEAVSLHAHAIAEQTQQTFNTARGVEMVLDEQDADGRRPGARRHVCDHRRTIPSRVALHHHAREIVAGRAFVGFGRRLTLVRRAVAGADADQRDARRRGVVAPRRTARQRPTRANQREFMSVLRLLGQVHGARAAQDRLRQPRHPRPKVASVDRAVGEQAPSLAVFANRRLPLSRAHRHIVGAPLGDDREIVGCARRARGAEQQLRRDAVRVGTRESAPRARGE